MGMHLHPPLSKIYHKIPHKIKTNYVFIFWGGFSEIHQDFECFFSSDVFFVRSHKTWKFNNCPRDSDGSSVETFALSGNHQFSSCVGFDVLPFYGVHLEHLENHVGKLGSIQLSNEKVDDPHPTPGRMCSFWRIYDIPMFLMKWDAHFKMLDFYQTKMRLEKSKCRYCPTMRGYWSYSEFCGYWVWNKHWKLPNCWLFLHPPFSLVAIFRFDALHIPVCKVANVRPLVVYMAVIM